MVRFWKCVKYWKLISAPIRNRIRKPRLMMGRKIISVWSLLREKAVSKNGRSPS